MILFWRKTEPLQWEGLSGHTFLIKSSTGSGGPVEHYTPPPPRGCSEQDTESPVL